MLICEAKWASIYLNMDKKLTPERKKRLQRNSMALFWLRALVNMRILAIVYSLFYVSRGLSLEEVFHLFIIWSLGNLFLEIPSSYLADRWGRKKTILLGIALAAVHGVVLLIADSFPLFAVGFAAFGASFAMLSGTDEALIYDTQRELESEGETLKTLGSYHSARVLFKMIAPIVAVFIAKDLSDAQFLILLWIDLAAVVLAFGFALLLTEANHAMDLEQAEAGVFLDAVHLLRSHPDMLRTILSRVLIFSATLVCWQYYQVFYTGLGLPLLALGIGYSLMHALMFFGHKHVTRLFEGKSVYRGIVECNVLATIAVCCIPLLYTIYPNPYILYTFFLLFLLAENVRIPLYSEFFNKQSHSFNRATTLSLTNLLKSVLDIPIMLIAGYLITISPLSPYVFAIVLCGIVVFGIHLWQHARKS